MAKLKIPRKLGELTPEWLTDALRENGVIGEARVVGVDREPLGEGAGFIGQLERLHLRYDVAEPGAPASVIAKLPTLVGRNRLMGELIGAYEREISFYQELASSLPCRVPRVYYAEMDGNPLAKQTPQIIAWIDRRPRWFIVLMMLFTLLFIKLSRRRYALLMEDMASAEVGDQVAGASPERSRVALRELATLHASLWQSPRLDAHVWLLRQDIANRAIDLLYQRSRPAFEKRFLGRHPVLGPYLDWLDQHADELICLFNGTSPHTLLHMDFRLDNLFFHKSAEADRGAERSDREITLFDWQVVARGPGIYDVAYFIASALPCHFGPEEEDALVAAYHEGLLAGGVRDYPLERCRLDYQRALMINLYRMTTIDILEFGDDRGVVLIDSWIERLSTRVARVDVEKLL